MSDSKRIIALFEPWSLGDSIIAASVSRLVSADTDVSLFINSKFKTIIEELLLDHKNIRVVGIDLQYTRRGNGFSFGEDLKKMKKFTKKMDAVYSIRGDFRDCLAAKVLFPDAQLNVNGWQGFFARRLAIVNAFFKFNQIAPSNRYELWSRLLNFDSSKLTPLYKPECGLGAPRILIHTGAQWRSRAYPYAEVLGKSFLNSGHDVTIGYGPGDPEPQTDVPVIFLGSETIVKHLKTFSLVITNDSAPMHLAAFLKRRVLAIANVADLREWLPPYVDSMVSDSMPIGYRPKRGYMSDTVLPDWPPFETVQGKILTMLESLPKE